MLENIKIDFEVLEMMIFYWESVSSKEKISDEYFAEIAKKKQMQILYGKEFSEDSVRKVLSAISNRELLNNRTQAESKFWNQNMRMLEDLTIMHAMMTPIKKLNLNSLKQNAALNIKELEIVFIPGYDETFYIDVNKIFINFFKILVNPENHEQVSVSGKPFKNYIEEIIISAFK